MHSLRKLACIGLVLSAVVFVAQAKTNYAYVANNSSNTVSVINTANDAVVTTIPVGTNPWGVAVNPSGTFAYVTNNSSNTVSVISTSTNGCGNHPSGYRADGRRVRAEGHNSVCCQREFKFRVRYQHRHEESDRHRRRPELSGRTCGHAE